MQAVIKGACSGVLMLAAAVGVSALSAPSQAGTLPAATFSNAANVTLPNSQHFADGSTDGNIAYLVDNNGITHWDFHTSNNYQTPAVSAVAISGPGVKGAAGSLLTYYIRFVGAPGTLDVNVRAAGGAFAFGPNEANSYGHNEASAAVYIARYYESNGGSDPDLVSVYVNSNQVGAPPANPQQSFFFNETVSFVANAIYRITMSASAQSWADDTAPNEGRLSSAYADPFFSGFGGYALEISDGIGNSLPVVATTPIPAALPLFASALAGLGFAGWRRRGAARLRIR